MGLQFDDEKPICFSIGRVKDQEELVRRIVQHGGKVTGPLYAHFHLGLTVPSGALRRVPVMHPAWITRSMTANAIVPLYEFIHEPKSTDFDTLSNDERDLAELLGIMLRNSRGQLLRILHEEFPHKTSNEWKQFYRKWSPAIDEVAKSLQERLDAIWEDNSKKLISALFPRALTLREASPGKIHETRSLGLYAAARHEIEGTGDEDNKSETSEVYRPWFKSQSPDDGLFSPEPGTEEKPKTRRYRLTPEDIKAMARFVSGLGREPCTGDWERFRDLREENQRRSAIAWKLQYATKRDQIKVATKTRRALASQA